MKKKMPIEKKVKLIYSGELIFISIVLLLIGILKMVDIIPTNPTRLLVYNIITMIGGVVLLGDFLWATFSKKRRANVCYLDKWLALPAGLYLIIFDIICFVKSSSLDSKFSTYSIGIVLIYIGAIYIFEGIYHWYHLTPQLQKAIEEEINNQKIETVIVEDKVEDNKEDNQNTQE